jgi:Protein of unknown function (DUF3558)
MRSEITRIRPVLAAAAGALAVALAGCGSSGTGASSGGASGSASSAPQALSTPSDSLALSHMKILTKLSRAQLCSVLPAARAARILHAATAPPVYARRAGVAVTCAWLRKGAGKASNQQLYVAIPTTISWTAAEAVDKALRSRALKIGGHPALAISRHGKVSWAQVDVALGGLHDPVADYRAPTMAGALELARAATPHILALG